MSQRFENFVYLFLKHFGLEVESQVVVKSGFRADFVVAGRASNPAIVEAKFYTSLESPKRAISDAVLRLKFEAERSGFRTAILVVNSRVDLETREFARSGTTKVQIYDYDTIERFCADSSELSEKFLSIVDEAFSYRSEPIPPSTTLEPDSASEFLGAPAPAVQPPEPPKRGADLCKQLKGHPKGRGKAAANYEKLCLEILQYVLDDCLKNWKPQRRTSSGIHIFDAIARVVSKHDFWQSVATDFRSRYIIFEFKNYASTITQAQVYSTEKYLLPLAMRGMGVIISRHGANKNAMAVMAGALRESGKLLLCLDDNDLCEMLRLRDEGGDATTVVAAKLDSLLECLDR